MKTRTVFIPVVMILAAVLIMVLLFSLRSDPPKSEVLPQVKIVETSVASLRNIPSTIIGLGKLASTQPLVLYSEVLGTIERGSIVFLPAQSFKKGDLLLKIDDRQVRLDINSTKSDFLNALSSVLPEIKVDFPEEFETWQSYFNKCGFDAPLPVLPETQNQKIKLFLSRFNVFKIYFSVRNLEIRLEKHFFYAPFNGTIVSTDIREGATARNGSRLGEILNLDDLEIEVPIPANDVIWIDRDKPVKLYSSELNREWQGKILRTGKSIDQKTQTVSVYVKIETPTHKDLFSGMFFKVQIPGKLVANALTVPRKIIYKDNYVYCIRDGRLDYREIRIARRETDTVIIDDGILEGDTLVTEVLQGVAGGMLATPKTIPPAERSN